MDAADLVFGIGRAALGASVALALVALLRRPMRRRFGASVAYAVWALLPAMVLAAAFSRPAAPTEAPTVTHNTVALLPGVQPHSPLGGGHVPTTVVVLGLWGAGALAFLIVRVRAQWRWRRGLGLLRFDHDDLAWSASSTALPALIGWPRARIVLPEDFATRFAPDEQALVLAHERRHRARGDLHAQLALEALRGVLWFHPLLPWAARALRHDQELACDAEVLARQPLAAADYARALLRAAAIPMPPLATAWGSTHPLKERLAMLQQTPSSPRARRLGAAFLCAFVALASMLAWAGLPRESPVPEGKLRQTWTLEVDGGGTLGPFLLVDAPGVPVEIRFENHGRAWSLTSAARALPDGNFDVQATIRRDGEVIATPRLVIDAKGGSMAIGASQEGSTGGKSEASVPGSVLMRVHLEASDSDAVAAQVPTYPEGLAAAGVEGRVLLRVAVDAQGAATAVTVEESSGHAALDEAAVVSVRRWRFNPAVVDGRPAAGEVMVPVDFRAKDEHAPDGG